MAENEILIGVVPVGNLGGQFLDEIMIGIKEVLQLTFSENHDKKTICCKPIPPRPAPIPASAYQSILGKYNIEPFFDIAIELKAKADAKLSYKGRSVTKVLVITNVPLFSYTNNCSVFGEAQTDGNSAVVSLHQIEKNAGAREIKERTIKECIHELGHTFGLRHCMDKKCVMSQSSDMYDVDSKSKYFCDGCRRMLRSIEFSKDYRTWKGF
ncbi:MAG: hypothetical protein JW825_06645 [Candidatus Methanofastidiosa archaeon]|nr:hypothetical protein [Candidatus Methanofastidiosa archaeon]